MVRLIGKTISILLATFVTIGVGTGTLNAQELTEGSIAVIQPKPVLLRHRVELIPRFGFTFNDTLIQQAQTGASVYYHISENFHVGGTFEWFDFGGELGGTTDTYEELIRTSSVVPEIAPITYNTSLDVGWVPIHGKFAVLDSTIAFYDIYTLLGLGVIDTIGDPNFAVSVAIGQRTFITDWVALLFEVRDRAYIEPLPRAGDTFTNIVSFSVGLGMFLPPSFEYTIESEPILDWE